MLVLLAAVPATTRAESVQLVNEQHARRAARCVLEERADPARSSPDEDFHEVGAGAA